MPVEIPSALVAELKGDFVTILLQCSRTALITYDHILTVSAEVAYVWRRKKWDIPMWLFLLNRYLLVVSGMLQIGYWNHKNSCAVLSISGLVINNIQSVIFTAFSASRVYALIWHQDRFHALTIAVLALGLVSIVINVYINSVTSWIVLDISLLRGGENCLELLNLSDKGFLYLQIAASGSVVCQELIVIVVTFYTLWTNVKESHKSIGPRTFSRVVLEGGIIYWGVVLVLDFANVLVIMHVEPFVFFIGPTSFPLQPIIISRFLLSLREVADGPGGLATTQQSEMSHPRFRVPTVLQGSFSMGNMGEPLEYAGADDFLGQDIDHKYLEVEDLDFGMSNGQIQEHLDDTMVRISEEFRV